MTVKKLEGPSVVSAPIVTQRPREGRKEVGPAYLALGVLFIAGSSFLALRTLVSSMDNTPLVLSSSYLPFSTSKPPDCSEAGYFWV